MDESEFNRIYREHRDAAYRYAPLLTGSPEAAEDITQECFLALASGQAVFLQVPRKGVFVLSVIEMPGKGFQRVAKWRETPFASDGMASRFKSVRRKALRREAGDGTFGD